MTTPDAAWTDSISDVAAMAGMSEAEAHQSLIAAHMRNADKRPSELALKSGLARRGAMGLGSQWNLSKTAEYLRTASRQTNAAPVVDTQPPSSPNRAGKTV